MHHAELVLASHNSDALAIAVASFFEAREKDIIESATLVVTQKK